MSVFDWVLIGLWAGVVVLSGIFTWLNYPGSKR